MFFCGKSKKPPKMKLCATKLEPQVEITLNDMNLRFNTSTFHWENKKAMAILNSKALDPHQIDPQKDLDLEDESGFNERLKLERQGLMKELDFLESELEEKSKMLILNEIKNEILKKMLFEESEKYKKYAEYDF